MTTRDYSAYFSESGICLESSNPEWCKKSLVVKLDRAQRDFQTFLDDFTETIGECEGSTVPKDSEYADSEGPHENGEGDTIDKSVSFSDETTANPTPPESPSGINTAA